MINFLSHLGHLPRLSDALVNQRKQLKLKIEVVSIPLYVQLIPLYVLVIPLYVPLIPLYVLCWARRFSLNERALVILEFSRPHDTLHYAINI